MRRTGNRETPYVRLNWPCVKMEALEAALTDVSNQNICHSLFESDERGCPRIVVGIVLLICVAAIVIR